MQGFDIFFCVISIIFFSRSLSACKEFMQKKDPSLYSAVKSRGSAAKLFTLNIVPSVITDKVIGHMMDEGHIMYDNGIKFQIYTNRSFCFWLMFIGFAIFLFKYG